MRVGWQQGRQPAVLYPDPPAIPQSQVTQLAVPVDIQSSSCQNASHLLLVDAALLLVSPRPVGSGASKLSVQMERGASLARPRPSDLPVRSRMPLWGAAATRMSGRSERLTVQPAPLVLCTLAFNT